MPDSAPRAAGIWAVLPVKNFDDAKQRLAEILNRRERRQLAEKMLEDVLTALLHTPNLAGVLVVTRDPTAKELASSHGAQVLIEPENKGQSAAVTRAAEALAAESVAGILTVPGDIPLVTTAEISGVLKCHGPASAMTIVPAWDRRGSNCIVCSPPDLIPFRFGLDSFQPHLSSAKNLGIEPDVTPLPGIGLDVDGPVEISMLLEKPTVSRAQAFLEEAGIADRLRAKNKAMAG